MINKRRYPKPHHTLREAISIATRMYPSKSLSPARSAVVFTWLSQLSMERQRKELDGLLTEYSSLSAAARGLSMSVDILRDMKQLVQENEKEEGEEGEVS